MEARGQAALLTQTEDVPVASLSEILGAAKSTTYSVRLSCLGEKCIRIRAPLRWIDRQGIMAEMQPRIGGSFAYELQAIQQQRALLEQAEDADADELQRLREQEIRILNAPVWQELHLRLIASCVVEPEEMRGDWETLAELLGHCPLGEQFAFIAQVIEVLDVGGGEEVKNWLDGQQRSR